MNILKIWVDNIARCTGYIIIVVFLILLTMYLVVCWREKYLDRKYRRNSIRVPYRDYQESNLGYIRLLPAAFIIADDLSDKDLSDYASQLHNEYDVYAVLLKAEENDAEKYLEEYIKKASENHMNIKRFIYKLPDGINLRIKYYKERIDEAKLDKEMRIINEGEFKEISFIYYTLYTKKGK